MTHERPRKRHEAPADPTDIHDEAGQDEERHREHRERVHPGHDLLGDQDERQIGHDDRDGGRRRQREADRHGGQDEGAEGADQEAAHHLLSPAPPASRWITMRPPETGAAA